MYLYEDEAEETTNSPADDFDDFKAKLGAGSTIKDREEKKCRIQSEVPTSYENSKILVPTGNICAHKF